MWDKQLYKCMRDVYRMASEAKKEDLRRKKWLEREKESCKNKRWTDLSACVG